MKKIRIAIIDDNKRIVELLIDIIKEEKDMEIVGTAFSGVEALSVIKENKPEIVLLDLIMPKLDGLGVIEKIQNQEYFPEFIILTALGQEHILEHTLYLGAKYYIKKPFNNEEVITKIRKINGQVPLPLINKNNEIKEKRTYICFDLELRVTDIIHKMGIPAHIKGYYYLRDAIMMSIGDKTLLNSVTKLLYPEVSKIYHTTPIKVESAIRHAIIIAWNNKNKNSLNELLGYNLNNKKKPTNLEFITLLVNKFRSEDKLRA